MKKIALGLLLAVSITMVGVNTAEAKTTKPVVRAHAICKDNTISYSVQRSGTCSHHKGVKKWLY